VWPSDLFAYRKQWEPFISAHLELWRYLNALFEATPAGQQCPPGFDESTLTGLPAAQQSFCLSLMRTRLYTDDKDPHGILTMWNAFAGKSASDIVAGAPSILAWLQSVVRTVGTTYKDELVRIAKFWNVQFQLPELPTLSAQQSIIATIEGAYTTAKGVLQFVGYGAGGAMVMVATQAQAVAEGLTNTVKALPNVFGSPWTWIGIATAVAVIGAGLVIYYVPREPVAEAVRRRLGPRAAPA
jgi:hypothetical protein